MWLIYGAQRLAVGWLVQEFNDIDDDDDDDDDVALISWTDCLSRSIKSSSRSTFNSTQLTARSERRLKATLLRHLRRRLRLNVVGADVTLLYGSRDVRRRHRCRRMASVGSVVPRPHDGAEWRVRATGARWRGWPMTRVTAVGRALVLRRVQTDSSTSWQSLVQRSSSWARCLKLLHSAPSHLLTTDNTNSHPSIYIHDCMVSKKIHRVP